MDFIKEYAVSIITVSVLSILLENILPDDSNKKYIRVMIGLLVMLVILNPLTKLPHYTDTFTSLRRQAEEAFPESSPTALSHVAESFQRRLALAVSEDLHSTYAIAVSCRVLCSQNESGQITGIQSIQLSPYTQEAAAYISEKYGVEEACITP